MPTSITKEEFDEKYDYRKRKSWLLDLVESIEINTGVKITKEEWAEQNYKSHPIILLSSAILQFRPEHRGRQTILGKKFTGRTLPDGWIIFRVK